MDSHPFFLGLHPSITFFTIKDVDPDSLCFFFPLPPPPKRLSGSPPVTVRIGHVRIIALFSRRLVNTHTRFSWAWLWAQTSRNGSPC